MKDMIGSKFRRRGKEVEDIIVEMEENMEIKGEKKGREKGRIGEENKVF